MATQPNDPIVDEVRTVRQRHAAQFGYDLNGIFRDIQSQQQSSGRTFVRYPARSVAASAVETIESVTKHDD